MWRYFPVRTQQYPTVLQQTGGYPVITITITINQMEYKTMPRIQLNQHFIDHKLVTPPEKKSVEFICSKLPGFYVSVTAVNPGVGTFVQSYKDPSGKRRHIKIARTTDMSLKEARQKAAQIRNSVIAGGDPQGNAMDKKRVPTWTEFFEKQFLPYSQKKISTWKNAEEMHRLRIKDKYGHLRLDQFKKHDVRQFILELKNTGLAPSTASKFGRTIHNVLNTAVDMELIDKNPISGIKLLKFDNRVENLMDETQFTNLMRVLRHDRNRPVSLFILWLIATGARRGESLACTWSQLDLEGNVWRIPGTSAKSGRTRHVPLSPAALSILSELPRSEKYDHVFLGMRDGTPLKCVKSVWERLRTKAGLDNNSNKKIRMHDLRHQFASILVNEGRTLYEVQKILGHSSSQITERYAHLAPSTLQAASNAASDRINAALKASE
jgi:integrase